MMIDPSGMRHKRYILHVHCGMLILEKNGVIDQEMMVWAPGHDVA